MITNLLQRLIHPRLMPVMMSVVFLAAGAQMGCTNGGGGSSATKEAEAVKEAAPKTEKVFVFHSVHANFHSDSPDLEVLEFHYGQAVKGPGGLQRSAEVGSGGVPSPSITGELPLPDAVHVKWRDKRTDKIYEEHVDMTSRLPSPKAMKGTDVYFLIDQFENRLFIYLVPDTDLNDRSVGRRPEGAVPNGPGLTSHLDVKTLYPDNSPPKPRGEYPRKWVELLKLKSEGLIVR